MVVLRIALFIGITCAALGCRQSLTVQLDGHAIVSVEGAGYNQTEYPEENNRVRFENPPKGTLLISVSPDTDSGPQILTNIWIQYPQTRRVLVKLYGPRVTFRIPDDQRAAPFILPEFGRSGAILARISKTENGKLLVQRNFYLENTNDYWEESQPGFGYGNITVELMNKVDGIEKWSKPIHLILREKQDIVVVDLPQSPKVIP